MYINAYIISCFCLQGVNYFTIAGTRTAATTPDQGGLHVNKRKLRDASKLLKTCIFLIRVLAAGWSSSSYQGLKHSVNFLCILNLFY